MYSTKFFKVHNFKACIWSFERLIFTVFSTIVEDFRAMKSFSISKIWHYTVCVCSVVKQCVWLDYYFS